MSEVSKSSDHHKIETSDKNSAEKQLSPDPAASATSDESEKKLTPEEQMALYEKELKENDWGHQPC